MGRNNKLDKVETVSNLSLLIWNLKACHNLGNELATAIEPCYNHGNSLWEGREGEGGVEGRREEGRDNKFVQGGGGRNA